MSNPAPTKHATPPSHAAAPATTDGELSHRQILEVMVGVLAALFTALISTTIVSTALPTIMAELHGTQRQYTWVITASLLAMTITTPIWGKLSDLFNKKLLIQLSIILFVAGSIGAGLSQEIWQMMTFRALQGVAMGGITALAQSIIGAIIPPRQRGRYSGYMGATMAVATVSGPLLGGVITDHIDWRWCFFVCVPLAVVALVLLQLTMKLPALPRRKVRIDYLGSVLIAIVAAAPMLWVTFAGEDYDWISWQTGAFAAVFVVAALLAVVVELKVPEPMVPIRVLANSTTALMIIASIGVGTAMFAGGTFMTQYFQLAGGHTPTTAGLMTIPLIVAQMLSSVICGQLVTRTGRWKPIMVIGSVLLVAGLAGLGTIDHTTSFLTCSIYMAVMGIGVGALIQNIVLAVQNTVDVRDIGASSATVAFFRSLGGAVGVSVLGAVLATEVKNNIVDAVSQLGRRAGAAMSGAGSDLDIADMPPQLQEIVHHAYGDSFGTLFMIAAGVAVTAILAIIAVREVPLRTTNSLEPTPAPTPGEAAEVAEASVAAVAEPWAEPETDPETHLQTGAVNGTRPAGRAAAADTELDDPAQRLSLAALDVLSAAHDRARAAQEAQQEQAAEVAARLGVVGEQVDAAAREFRRRLEQIRDDLLADRLGEPTELAPAPDGRGGTELRRYEHHLLLDSQQTADRVTRAAREEAERTVSEARTELADLQRRIEQLRAVEAELSGRVADRLS